MKKSYEEFIEVGRKRGKGWFWQDDPEYAILAVPESLILYGDYPFTCNKDKLRAYNTYMNFSKTRPFRPFKTNDRVLVWNKGDSIYQIGIYYSHIEDAEYPHSVRLLNSLHIRLLNSLHRSFNFQCCIPFSEEELFSNFEKPIIENNS